MAAKLRKSIITLIFLASMSSGAHAALLSYDFSYTGDTHTNWSYNFDLPKLGAGTLNSLQLQLWVTDAQSNATITNYFGVNNGGTYKTEVLIDIGAGVGSLSGTKPIDFYTNPSTFGSLLTVFPEAGSSVSTGTLTGSGSSDNTYTDPALLALFTGSGNITLPVSASSEANLTFKGGALGVNESTTVPFTGRITYDYTAPVPEPATMLLLGAGLVGFAGLNRRRFWKKK